MATRMHIFGKPSYIYPQPEPQVSENDFEFDESDIHYLGDHQVPSKRSVSMSRLRRKPSKVGDENGNRRAPKTGSLPVNIPDWSKILKSEYKKSHHHVVHEDDESDEDDEDDEQTNDGGGKRIVPPHEYLARRRGASFSVHEGIGGTLKGRDLRRVRNAIWEKLGFQD